MTARRLVPGRIALRIYLVTVATLLTTAAAAFLILRYSREPPLHFPLLDMARYASARIGERWPAAQPARAEVARAEVEALAGEARFSVALYDRDGTPLASGGGPPEPPLSAEERAMVLARGHVERGDCGRGPCAVGIAIAHQGAKVGYLLLAPPRPPALRGHPALVVPIVVMLVAVGIAAVLLGASMARPLDRLGRAARALGSGDLSARAGLARRDELGDVARAFDEMADRVVALLRGQTELIANVAHELRTPLARIRVALDLAADGDAEVARTSLAEIGADLAELERLVADVLASARMDLAANTAAGGEPPLHRGALEVGRLVAGSVDRLRSRFPERRVEVEVAAGLPEVEGDAVLLRRALDNLLDNARKYSPAEVAIRVRAAARPGGVAVEVIDGGEGIGPEDLERLFTPFFRTDRSRARATGGVGLGLALSRRIVRAHGGDLSARSAPGEGTTLTLTLPAASAGP